jgi:hypothetical protein
MKFLLPLALCLLAAPAAHAATITSPEPLPAKHDRPRIFLGGSIDMGNAPDWQKA